MDAKLVEEFGIVLVFDFLGMGLSEIDDLVPLPLCVGLARRGVGGAVVLRPFQKVIGDVRVIRHLMEVLLAHALEIRVFDDRF